MQVVKARLTDHVSVIEWKATLVLFPVLFNNPMSFIDSLDISAAQQTLSHFFSSLSWNCVASVSNSLTTGSTVSLSFEALDPTSNTTKVFCVVEWTHSVTQLAGHYLYSGKWKVTSVKFSGLLFDSSARLLELKSLLAKNKLVPASALEAARKEIQVLSQQLEQSKSSVTDHKQQLIKLKDSLKQSEARQAILEAQNKDLARELQNIHLLNSGSSLPAPSVPSSSTSNAKSNDDLLNAWAAAPAAT
uniref:Uncharacterized protein n=1 Tax=Potato rugose stunting virus TaxID=3064989 RepID=A0AA49K6A0_9SECO|nr:hypothetical protein [Potato rugose stunting virus]